MYRIFLVLPVLLILLHSLGIAKDPGNEAYEFLWPGKKIVAIGDLHGDLINTLLLLHTAGIVDLKGNWSGEDTLLIQTGDVVDRGPEGKDLYDYFKQLSEQAEIVGGRVIQLLGNHDVMNICGDFRYAHPEETHAFGNVTKRRVAFSEDGEYGKLLRSFSVAFKIDEIVFTHAGITRDFAELGLKELTDRLREELSNDCKIYNEKLMNEMMNIKDETVFVGGINGPLWTRDLSLGPEEAICERLEKSLNILKAQKMVIGHTVQESGKIGTHCKGKLVFIDTGVSRYVANQPKLLEIVEGQFFEHSARLASFDENGKPKFSSEKRNLDVTYVKPRNDLNRTMNGKYESNIENEELLDDEL